MIALIDADSLLYKAGFTFEEKFDWNEWEVSIGKEAPQECIFSNTIEAKNAIDSLIENIKFNTGCDEVELWLTAEGNFRYDVLDTYKSNRKGSRKPKDFQILWKYLVEEYNAQVAVGYEADDVVVYKKTKHPEDYFLCAIDKDVLLQSVGTHYNYNKDEFIEVNGEEAERFFYYQVLVGDTVDGYKGCPGIGNVKANKILDKAKEEGIPLWEAVRDTFEDKGFTEEDAIIQARLASMHQLEATGKGFYKVVLWEPDSVTLE